MNVQPGPLDELRRELTDLDALELARELVRLEPEDQALRFRLLPKQLALTVFEALDPTGQHELLQALRDPHARELFEEMDPDDRAWLLEEVPAKVARQLLDGLSAEERALTAVLLGYPEDSVGRVMSPEYVTLREHMTVGEALAHVRRVGAHAETLYMLPVVDTSRCLVGSVELRDLVLVDPDLPLAGLIDRDARSARAREDQEPAARLVQEANLLALPVVDDEHRLVGVLTVDDAMRVLRAEETEDTERVGGAQPLGRPYLGVPVMRVARSRAGWLLLLAVAATLTVGVLQIFEDALEAVVALALFVPLVIGTGGNAGAQAATTVVRAMALGEVRPADALRIAAKEFRVGLLLGVTLGGLSLLPIGFAFDARIALVVGGTLLLVCMIAALAGALLPLGAKAARIDPAVVSAPLITTVVDASGLLIYFLVARIVLGV